MPRPTLDEAGLLRAVGANPADDLARLVYADWLDEHGRHPRAEFIRVQVDLHGTHSGKARFERLRGRERELLDAHAAEWLRDLPRWARWGYQSDGWRRVDYERGFPAELALLASPFVRFGGDLLDRVPAGRVELLRAGKLLPAVAACEWFGRVPVWDLSYGPFADRDLVAVAASPHLAGVREMNFRCCEIGDAGVRALAASPHAAGLRRLDLSYNNLSLGGVKALAASPYLRDLEWVEVADNRQLAGHRQRVEELLGGRTPADGTDLAEVTVSRVTRSCRG